MRIIVQAVSCACDFGRRVRALTLPMASIAFIVIVVP
jgi:hypothetical protein